MLKELRTFIAVARHGTFSRAGEHIGLTQSAVSAQIQRLEASLGFALFDRAGRTATLNDAGRDTLARAEALVLMADQLHAGPGAADFSVAVGIGASASVQAGGLPAALVALRRNVPQVRLRVVPGVSLALLGMVDAGELDAAVMIRPPFSLPPELVWEPLWQEPFVLLAPPPAKGRSNRDWRRILASEPFLRYDRASFGGRLVDRFLRSEAIEVQDAVEMDELEGIVQLVGLGMGAALLPRVRANWRVPEGVRVVTLGDATFHREIGMVTRARPAQAGIVGGLRDALRKPPNR